MIRDLLTRWAYAAERAELQKEIRALTEQLSKSEAERKRLYAEVASRAERFNKVVAERDTLQARLDAPQPTLTEADLWQPAPGDLVSGESLVLGQRITGRFERWHHTGLFAVLSGGRRVYTRTLRPAEQQS